MHAPAQEQSLIAAIRPLFRTSDAGIWVLATCSMLNLLHLALLEPLIDHGPVYRAARAVLDGRPPYPSVTHGGDYVHTPGSTVISVPFGLIGEHTGGVIVVLLSAAAFILGTLAAAAATSASPRATAIALLAFGLGGPLLRELGLGNVDALLVLPLGLALFYLTRGRPMLAGALIGLAMTIKPTIVLVVLLPLAMGFAGGTVSAIAVAGAVNLAALPFIPEASRFFTSTLPFLLDGQTAGFNVSLKASLERTGAPDELVALLRVVCAGLLVWSYVRFREQFRRHPAVLVAFIVLGTMFVTSYFFTVYFVYLGLAVGVLSLLGRPLESAMLALSAYLLLSLDTLRSSNELLDVILGFRRPAGGALLLGALVLVMIRDERAVRRLERVAEAEAGGLPPAVPAGSSR